MPPERAYGSPKAFRQALTDKLKSLAAEGPWGLPELQRQIAYDRVLARLYLVDRGWIVKGATALLARELGVRATIDIDLYRDTAVAAAERELREAAAPTSATGSASSSAPPARSATGSTPGGCRSRP
jgi:hypothetical protein